jgi:hypothetical protein
VVTVTWQDDSAVDTFTPTVSGISTANNGIEFAPYLVDGAGAEVDYLITGSGTSACTLVTSVIVTSAIPTGTYDVPSLAITLGGGLGASGEYCQIVVEALGQGMSFL